MKNKRKKVFAAMSRLRQGFGGQAGGVRTSERQRVFVAMSGGVDSSVAALLLKERGYDVVGVFMKCWSQRSSDALGVGADCTAEADATDARRVAEKLGIPFYVWDFEKEYKKRVVEYMVDGYRRGLTPNPDVMCNKEIKFGLFLERALAMGADHIATGHYVRICGNSLFEAKDKNKDQSYFLWTLTQKQLKHCLFPVGDYLKPEVRKIARKADLPTADKKDSQGICFLGKVTLAEFLGGYLPAKKGVVFNTAGEAIGKHSGAHFYTIGQRHGLVSGNWKRNAGESKPFYVAGKDIRENTIVVADDENSPELFRKGVKLAGINLINPISDYKLPITVLARVRYRQPLAKAVLSASSAGSVSLTFDKPQKFVAPGQSAVLYSKKGQVLGGGVII